MPVETSKTQDVPEDTLPPEPPLVPPSAPETASTPHLPLQLPRRSISAIVADLSRRLPEPCIAKRKQAGENILYLHWQTVERLLNTYAPDWHGCVTRMDQVGKTWAVTYRLTIPCLEGEVSREATGQEDEEVKSFGDTTSNAEAMAFKRAAAKFGVGLWLYDKDDGTGDALRSHLNDERTAVLADMGKLVDEVGLDREAVITWLRCRAGALSNAPDSALGHARLPHPSQYVRARRPPARRSRKGGRPTCRDQVPR